MRLLLFIIILYPAFIEAQVSNIILHKIEKTDKSSCFFTTYDKYGEWFGKEFDYESSAFTDTISLEAPFPRYISFGARNTLVQPFIITDKNMIIAQKGIRVYVVNDTIDNTALLLERMHYDKEVIFDNKADYSDSESNIAIILDTTKENNIFSALNRKLIKQKNYIDTFSQHHFCDATKIRYLYKVLDNSYILSCLYKLIDIPDSLPLNVNELNELANIRQKCVDKLDSEMGIEKYARGAVYAFNYYLCRRFVNTDLEFKAQWDTASSVFVGKTKTFLHFVLLKKYLGKGVNDYDAYFNAFIDTCKDKDYCDYLKNQYDKNKFKLNNEKVSILTDTLLQNIEFKDIIDRNKGQILYLDVWASWCNPCKKEMAYYPLILNELSQKNVKPIFISIDDNKISWKKSIEKLNITHYEHYCISNKDDFFIKLFDIQTIPRYIIINEKGEIIDANAPRPSDKELLFKRIETMRK